MRTSLSTSRVGVAAQRRRRGNNVASSVRKPKSMRARAINTIRDDNPESKRESASGVKVSLLKSMPTIDLRVYMGDVTLDDLCEVDNDYKHTLLHTLTRNNQNLPYLVTKLYLRHGFMCMTDNALISGYLLNSIKLYSHDEQLELILLMKDLNVKTTKKVDRFMKEVELQEFFNINGMDVDAKGLQLSMQVLDFALSRRLFLLEYSKYAIAFNKNLKEMLYYVYKKSLYSEKYMDNAIDEELDDFYKYHNLKSTAQKELYLAFKWTLNASLRYMGIELHQLDDINPKTNKSFLYAIAYMATNLPFEDLMTILEKGKSALSNRDIASRLYHNNFKYFGYEKRLALYEKMMEMDVYMHYSLSVHVYGWINWDTIENPDEMMMYLLNNQFDQYAHVVSDKVKSRLNEDTISTIEYYAAYYQEIYDRNNKYKANKRYFKYFLIQHCRCIV